MVNEPFHKDKGEIMKGKNLVFIALLTLLGLGGSCFAGDWIGAGGRYCDS